MDFSEALTQLKAGKKMSRDAWAGKYLYVEYFKAKKVKVSKEPVSGVLPPGDDVDHQPRLDLLAVNGEIVKWVVADEDLLAEDWGVRVSV